MRQDIAVKVSEKNIRFLIRRHIVKEDKEGKGKCPDSGCVQPIPGKERKYKIVSNDTGECWGRSKKSKNDKGKCTEYDSREEAEGALGG